MRAPTSTHSTSPASMNRTSVALTLIAIGMLFLLALLKG